MSTKRDSGDGRARLLAISAKAPWPVTDGYSLRAGGFLERLSQRWTITVLSPSPEGGAGEAPEGVRWIRLPGVPATNALPWRPEREVLVRQVRRHVEEQPPYRALLVWNGTEFVAGDLAGLPPAVGDRIDCEALQAWRGLAHRSGLRQWLRDLRRTVEFGLYERRVLRNLAGLAVTAPDDARALRRLSGHERIVVIPNGVALPELEDLPGEAPRPVVIFTGVLAYGPNIEAVRHFASRVWPGVLERVARARFVVAGRSPADEVERMAEAVDGMEVRTDVPDMTAELRRAWVAVAPMRSGSGIKNKVLEAWAAERPVVLTRMATNGLHMTRSTRRLVRDDPDGMREAVVHLLEHEEERRALGRDGRRAVEEHHGWGPAADRLHELLAEACGP